MKDFVKIATLLAFVALMLIKVSSFHVYSHIGEDSDTTIENCGSCELAIEQQQNEFTAPTTVHFQKLCITFGTKKIVSNYQVFTIEVVPSDFLSRPPPAVI